MKKLNRLLTVPALLCILSPLGFAETKIAVIDLERAVLTTKFAQQQEKNLTSDPGYKALVEKFELLKADLQSLEKEASTKGMTWSNEQRVEHSNKVEYKSADYQLVAKKIESQRNSVANEIKKQFAITIKEVVNKIIEDEGISILLNAKAAHFAAPGFDITAKVTAGLDAKN
jgi:outer membrane protein